MTPSDPGLVGLVVVSHSRALAQAAIALAGEMLHDDAVRLEEAGGLDDGSIGTDALRIADAIARADGGRGVVVLMDLGGAVLSAELALDLVDPAQRGRVTLCAAPLVEGLCVAAVAAAGGANRDEVAAEARRALAAKEEYLGVPAAPARGDAGGGAPDVTGRFEVTWVHGLHARPAAVLVRTVQGFDADVRLRNVTRGGSPVPGRSLSRVAALGAEQGHVVEVTASGLDAQRAVERLLELARDGFGDLDKAPSARVAPVGPRPSLATGPLPASPGTAVGPAWLLTGTPDDAVDSLVDAGPAGEEGRLRTALATVQDEVRRTREATAAAAGEPAARVFDAHLLLLDDPDLLERAVVLIARGRSAHAAWRNAVGEAAAALAELPDDYQRARADDVRAVGRQVEAHLRGVRAPDAELPAGSVLVAQDLTPAQAAALDPARVAAVVLAAGSPTSHAVILVRALGIPAVVGAGAAVLGIRPGTAVAVDGTRGEVVVDPPSAVRAVYEERASAMTQRREAAQASASAPALTRDGVRVHVGANLASLDDARTAAAAGADLAGLVRTELMFLDRRVPPSVDEQADAYRALADALPDRRVVVRTLDAGGDKPLPYLPVPAEANPFLGVRGIRLSLRRPELLLDQLRAIVRVAQERPIDVMFPMVSTVGELLAVRRILQDAADAEDVPTPPGLRVGVMVEVPATALKAAAFAPHVDFFSIGTNDLTQYALAADRGNDAVAALADPLDPGLLALVAAVTRAGRPVAVCGEMAADESAIALLLGLGVRELSVSPGAVPVVKQAVREVRVTDATALAARALAAPDAAGVRSLL